MKPRSHIWNELRSPEVAEARDAGAVVLMPIGATEQHGAHLPVNTDILSARSVALAAAERLEQPPALVVDSVSIGYSPHHMLHAGSLTLRLETFTSLVRDLVTSIRNHGFERLIIVNGHGGNIAPLSAVAHELAAEGSAVVVCSYWDLIRDEIAETLTGWRKSVGHAGEFETSMLLHLLPGSVDQGAAVNEQRPPWNPALENDPIEKAGAIFPPLFAADSTGVLGDATSGSGEKGRALFELAAGRLAELTRVVAETELPPVSVWMRHGRSSENMRGDKMPPRK